MTTKDTAAFLTHTLACSNRIPQKEERLSETHRHLTPGYRVYDDFNLSEWPLTALRLEHTQALYLAVNRRSGLFVPTVIHQR